MQLFHIEWIVKLKLDNIKNGRVETNGVRNQ